MKQHIKILIVDDHTFIRAGYTQFLNTDSHLEIVGEAESGRDAYSKFVALKPDLVTMDLNLPDITGIEASRRILKRDENARILMASMQKDPHTVDRALKAGILGYITKESSKKVFIEAVRKVASGKLYLEPEIALQAAENNLSKTGNPFDNLTNREQEVLSMMLTGKETAEISEGLCVSKKTISNICSSLKKKLNVSSAVDLYKLAEQFDLVNKG